MTLAATLSPLLGLADADAGQNKKKRRKNKPFCAKNDSCVTDAQCDDGSGERCSCGVTVETGDPCCGIINAFPAA